MNDVKKKVIDGLERHMHGLCHNTKVELCPYWYVQAGCSKELINDTLTVIRSHEAEIKKLNKAIEEKQKHLENLQAVNEELEKRIAIMSEGKEWVSVEDHMPDEGRGCFVVIHYDHPYAGEGDVVYGQIIGYSSGDWVDDEGEIFMQDVTHWQYANIPEPPKEGEQEAQQDYERNVEYAQYCERYEPTYNPEDGSM